nr:hypothetical protein [Tanacetum cinerariifolium]
MNDVDDRWNKIMESGNKIIQILGEMVIQREQAANLKSPFIVITNSFPVLPIEDPEDSLIMGNEDLNTNPEKESDEFIKSSVEDLVPILSESRDTSESESVCILPSCDDFSPIDSLSDEDIPQDNVKIYSNPLFEFDDEYNSSDVNHLFDEVLENIECKDSYDPNLDESTILVTPLFDSNEDEYFTPSDDVELLLHHDPSIPKMSVASIFEGFTDEPPLEENDDLFDLESKNDEWKKILYDDPILMTEDKVFDPGIHDEIFSPTYVSLPFTDYHYLFFTYVVRIFLPHIIYSVESPFLISFGREDTIFDLGISAFHFSNRSGTFISFNERTIPLNEIISQIPSSIIITTSPLMLPIKYPKDSLIMGNEELNIILEKESDEFIKSSVEDFVPIPSESEDTPGSESVCILPSCDDFSPIDVP